MVVEGQAYPAGHAVQVVEPATAYDPALQVVMPDPSLFGQAEPAGQMVQESLPPVE